MSTTLKKITEFLDLEGLEYMHKEGKQHLRLRLPTKKYMQPGARHHHIDLVIALDFGGPADGPAFGPSYVKAAQAGAAVHAASAAATVVPDGRGAPTSSPTGT